MRVNAIQKHYLTGKLQSISHQPESANDYINNSQSCSLSVKASKVSPTLTSFLALAQVSLRLVSSALNASRETI